MHTYIHANTTTNMRGPAKNKHAHAHKEEEEAELFVAAVHRVRNCLEIGNCLQCMGNCLEMGNSFDN